MKQKILISWLYLICTTLCTHQLNAQVICTFAGNGSSGFSGGAAATATSISPPLGVALDAKGNTYFVGYEIVSKVDASGILTIVSGSGVYGYSGDGGPATAAALNFPEGIAVDNRGNIYFSEVYGARIRKIDTNGIIHTVAGNDSSGYIGDGGPATNAELNWPRDIAIDNIGNLYIADYKNSVVRKVDTFGIITTIAGNGVYGYNGDGIPATAAQLDYPNGVAVDSSGNVYIADGSARIRKVNSLGIISTIAGNGTFGNSGDDGPATAAEISQPYYVKLDNNGNIYVTDVENNNVRKINALGIISTIAGIGPIGVSAGGYSGDGSFATLAELNYPVGIAIDTAGNVFISDNFNLRVRKISKPKIELVANTDTICFGDSVHFRATATNVCYPNFQWKINGLNFGMDSFEFTTNVLSNGDTVTCSLIAAPGDTIIATSNQVMIFVENCNLGFNEIIPKIEFDIYPIPSSTDLTIESSIPIAEIIVTDIFGRMRFTGQYNAKQVKINVSSLPQGVYFVKINNTEIRKFIKE